VYRVEVVVNPFPKMNMKNLFTIIGTPLLFGSFLFINLGFTDKKKMELLANLQSYCATLPTEFNQISEERKLELLEISDFVTEKRSAHLAANLNFVCTSNSRRSHLAQIWAQTASMFYGIDSVWTFSGGTEETRVHKNTIAALGRSGMEVVSNQQSDNPIWLVTIGKGNSWAIFSKKYDHATNPKTGFGAVMVCSEADKSCPSVPGADFRLGLPYEDPKLFDKTDLQDKKYDERCRQIAREMFFVMKMAKKKLDKK
jgi:arsenate reductase